ncbi:MAG: NarK/NasA family nitrate transporter [Elusimicrobia bacterium]|nr:NarK/NasA family nitrate transporter [Elusimicrobiota bacterium]
MATWIERWEPENEAFWNETGGRIAWRTLAVTTASLVLSFASWFMMSAVVVRLPSIGFAFTPMELFWLAAMPGLAGGTLRIVNTFLIPVFGTRAVVTSANFLKLIPCVGLGLAIADPATPLWVFMALAFVAGLGGGDFSSFMPSTSLFFPKRLQGAALGIQAGVGNFGVSLVQFVAPWIVGFAAFGTLAGGPQSFVKGELSRPMWLQNAAYIWVPFLLVCGVASGAWLRSLPVRASFREQLDIFKDKHTWFCTITYVMTFGSFSGFAAAFPLMIKQIYGVFPDAPDPLRYAFYGPLIGSLVRVLFGFVADKTGGAVLTQLSGLGMIGCVAWLILGGTLTPDSAAAFPAFVAAMLALFFFCGIGNAATFRQYPIIFGHSPRQAAGVLGWTAAVAAYGPFVFASLIGKSITVTGSATAFFCGAAVFYALATGINWWYYARTGCERPC